MINSNEFFNFIDNIIVPSKTTKFDNCEKISTATTLNAEIYIRLDLKRDKNSSISDDESCYILQDHHISFYKIPQNGQYHYTAYFLDTELKNYQLHVYFDEQDELIKHAPVEFSKYNDEAEEYQSLASENLNEQFITLANNKITPIIHNLREQHTKKVELLKEQYEQQEQKSSSLSKNIIDKNYVKSLEKTLKILEQLIALGGKSYYQSTKKILEGSISYIKEQKNSVSTSTSTSTSTSKKKQHKTKKEQDLSNKNSISASEIIVVSKLQKKTASSSNDSQLETSINTGRKILEKLDELSVEQQITVLKNLFLKVNQWILTNEKKELFHKINELYKMTYVKGGSLLCDLITLDNVKNRFALAAQLEPFHDGLNSTSLSMALDAGDHELLDFILTYKKFHINALSFEIDKVFYPSAVHFCYQIDHESMIPCLAVLIKHGASVFVKDDQGLPIAYKILSEPAHPLQQSFEDNKEITIKSAPFYQKLIKSLENCLNLPNLDEEEKQKIKLYVQKYININSATQLPKVTPSQLSFFTPPLNKTDINSEKHEEQNKNILQ